MINMSELSNFEIEKTVDFCIDDDTFESVQKRDWEEENPLFLSLEKWYNELQPISDYKSLVCERKSFISKFRTAPYKPCFFSLIMHKCRADVEDAIIEFFCRNYGKSSFNYELYFADILSEYGEDYELYFADILSEYGEDAAQKAINNYNPDISDDLKKRRKEEFKAILTKYKEGYSVVRRGAFSKNEFYYAETDYYHNSSKFMNVRKYFVSLSDLAKSLIMICQIVICLLLHYRLIKYQNTMSKSIIGKTGLS